MVYKKYILKNGKLHGPYYYESYREGNAVKKRYLGSSAHSIPSLDRSFIIPLVLIALASMLLIFFSYKSITGYSVGDANSEVPASSPDIQDTTENTEISTESPSLIENVPFVEISPGPSSDSRENTEIPEDNSQESGLIIENGEEETLNDSQEDSNISDNLNESLLQEQNNVSEETNETIAPRIPDTNFSTENNSSINNTLIIPPENITEEDNKTIQIPSEIIENNNISNQTNYAEMLNFTETNETLKNITNSTPNIVNIHSLELLKDFPTLRIPRNGELLINLSEYFKGAESYEILIPNIVPFIEGDTLSLKAEQGFSGAKRSSDLANAGNESLESNQFTILVSGGAVTITTKREKIKAGEPVRWTKNISLDNPENITLALPAGAENISVKKLSEDFQTSLITANVISDGSAGYSVWLKLKSLLGKIFSSFTGRAIQYEVAIVQDKNDVSNQTSIQVILNASASDYIIEYYTDGPEIHESEISSGKQVTISAPDEFNYTDIIAYSNVSSILGFSELKTLKIYWYNYESGNIFVNISKRVEDLEDNTLIEFVGDEISEDSENTSLITSDSSYENSTLSIESNLFSDYNDSLLTGAVISSDEIISESNQSEVNYLLQEIPYDAYDLDEDGYIDYVEWVVPHLSNQTYQLVTSNRDFAVSSNITLEDQFSHLSINVANAPYNSLIGYLPFDADNVSMGHDYSSSRNDFTYSNGAVPTDNCIYESCVQLDGVNDAVIAPTGVYNFSINDSFTLMAWIYPFVKGNENAERGIMGRYTGAVGSGYYYFTIDGTDGGGATDKLEFRMSGNNNTVLINQNANTTITNEQWTHVAVTYNGSQVILYKDGSIESGGNIATNAVNINSSAAFQVGAAGSSAFVFNGTIDEAMVFNTSLTQTQIQSIMNNQSSRFVYTGDVETRNINVSLLNENILNISIPDAERELGTNISLRLGEWDISLGYNNSDVNSAIPGLVSYWHLDNNSAIGENDTFVVDSMGRNNGTANHTVINNWGVFEKSHKFDDNSSHVIQVADSSSLNITTALTISGWIYRNRGGQAGDVILEHQPANGFYALFFEGNQIRFRLAFANSTTVTVSPTKLVTKGQWHHVVGTWNGTRAKVYLDGVNLGSEQNFFGSLAGKSGIVQIGRITSGSPRTNGSLDEIMIFNRSLTDNEVQELYVRGRALWSYGSYVNLSDSTRRYDYSSDCLNGLLMVFDNDENDICGLFQANLNSPGNWTNSNRGSLGNATLGIPSSTAGMYLTNDSQLAHLNNSFTLGTWVLAPYFGANSEAIIKIQDDSTKNFTQIDITSSNTLRALFDTSNRSSYAVTLSSASVTDGRWHYLALAYSANTKKAVLSVDGFRYNASSLVDGYLQFKSANITIGGRKGWYLDDISIWNRSLDEEEIIDIYSKTKHTRKEASFSITSDTTNVLPSWRLVTGPNNFYSPNVGGLLRATYDFQAAVDLTPTVSSVVLDSSSGTDTINENISVTFSQSGAGNINNITDWRLQNKSIAVLNMPFESNLSSTVKKIMRDYSTYNQNGTLGGGASSFVPVWNASGRVGGAYEFDGANDYINISGGNLSLIEGFSISSWVYLKAKPGTAGHWSSIVTRGIDGEGSTQNHNYLLGFANTVFGGTGFDFTIENSVGTNCDANTLDDEPTNKWYLLTGVFDSTAQRLLLYVNGTLQSNVSCTITPNTPALDVRIC